MRSTEYVDINLSSHNSLFQMGRFLKTELSGSRSVACCRWMLFALPFPGPSRQFWCCGLLSLSWDCFLCSTAPRSPILSFTCFSPYRATWGPSSVQSLVLEFLWLPSHDPLSFYHSSVNSSAFGTLLAVSISVTSVFVCISMPSSTQEAEAADSGVKASWARLYQGKSKDKAEWSKDKFPGIGGMT